MKKFLLASVAALAIAATGANASPFTTASPNGALPGGITSVGGIVLDLVGTNGTRVVSQLAASSLFVGYADDGTPTGYRGNPLTIGIQSGFTPAVVAALGGGLSSAAVRISLYDGDTGPGNFDDGANFLGLNGVAFGANGGDFSSVQTEQTDGSGNSLGALHTGFNDSILDTGFFVADVSQLAAFYATLSLGEVKYTLNDTSDPYDNYFDFTQGIDGGLVDVGTGPTVTGTPEPASMVLLGSGLLGFAAMRRRKKAA
jgi:hypothetical protein